MKKFLVILLLIILIPVAALGVFLATFDANRYKPLISENLEKFLGHPVEIGDISLKWDKGIALKISNLAVYPDREKNSAPGMKLESASAQLQLMPLLQKNIQITTIALNKPSLSIVRREDGILEIGGIDFSKIPAASGQEAPSATQKTGGGAFLFSIGAIAVNDGHVRFQDRTFKPALSLDLKKINVKINRFSPVQPFDYQASASFLSDKENLRLSGKALLPGASQAGYVEDLFFETDLSDLNMQAISAAFPAAAQSIEGSLSGRLTKRVKRMNLDAKGIEAAEGVAELKGGRFTAKPSGILVDNIDALVSGQVNQLRLEHLNANIAGGTLAARGAVSGLKTEPLLDVQGSLKGLPLQELVKQVNLNTPSLNGHVSVDFQGRARGVAWESVSKTLNGRARLVMNDGVLLNYNLLKEMIDKLSVIPGAQQAFAANFPQAYQLRMRENSTILKPIDLSANIVNGVLNVDPLVLETDFIMLNGKGHLGLDRSLRIEANLIMNAELSKACVGVINMISYLYNNRNEVVVPVVIKGDLPQVKIVPDSKYITDKLMTRMAQGAVEDVVQDIVENPGEGIDKIEDLLKKNIKKLNL